MEKNNREKCTQDAVNKKANRRRRRWPIVLISLGVVVCLVAALVFAANRYVDDVFDPGPVGTVDADYGTDLEYKGDVLNILLVGIFIEPDKNFPEGLGLTDMIMYVNYDIKNDNLNFFQIPRDTYVGEIPGSDGKINSLMVTGEDKENPINNLVSCITDQFKLPIDRYIHIEMEALKDIVNALGAIEVYVPQRMEYDGSVLEEGLQYLDGESVEFFVRNRHGSGFMRGDIDRLDNQRHFYSALFKRLLTMSPAEIMKMMPIFAKYCSTDLTNSDLIGLASAAQRLKSENILFCKAPGATGENGWQADPLGFERSFYIVDVYGRGEDHPGVADLLNEHFRTYGEPVPAEELNLPKIKIPDNVGLYPPNVQRMAQVQEGEEPAAQSVSAAA